jgi:4-diphosphocytidyl-2-C-methyl-D-erythritol kinase
VNPRDLPTSCVAASFAKVNLFLRVGGPDAQQFHPLVSWMTTVSLCDELRFRFENASKESISIACESPGIPTDSSNLIWRAIELLKIESSVHVHLQKRIPAGGGMGGGSSNAAATLETLARRFKLSQINLHDLARQLGSDVPFFLGPPSSLAQGRGERLTPAPVPVHAKWIVLMLPRSISINTAACYRRLDALRPVAPQDTLVVPDIEMLSQLSVDELLATLVNDLEPPAFSLSPELAELRQRAQATARRVVRMSGSGSTLFTLAQTADDADQLIDRLRGDSQLASVELLSCELARHRNGEPGNFMSPSPGGPSGRAGTGGSA